MGKKNKKKRTPGYNFFDCNLEENMIVDPDSDLANMSEGTRALLVRSVVELKENNFADILDIEIYGTIKKNIFKLNIRFESLILHIIGGRANYGQEAVYEKFRKIKEDEDDFEFFGFLPEGPIACMMIGVNVNEFIKFKEEDAREAYVKANLKLRKYIPVLKNLVSQIFVMMSEKK